MKKILPILTIILSLFLTGCGKNRLVCNTSTNSANYKYESKYIFTFNGDNVKLATMTKSGTLSADLNTEANITAYKAEFDSAASSYNATEGITASVSTTKNKHTLTVKIDPSKLSDDDKVSYGLDLTKDELKEELKNQGYTCK